MVPAESAAVKALAPRKMQSVPARSWRLLITTIVAAACADASAQSLACPKRPSSASGRSFQNQNLALVNFSRIDLTNANFRGATLKGVSFIRANLTGADFSGATFVDTGNPGRSSDFSFAQLDSACFIGAKFQAPTYFTYATLTSADFSQTDLSNGNAIFGDQPLRFDATAPLRLSFRSTIMNCEFVAKWNQLDLTGASIGACRDQLKPGHDFSGARMAGVVFDGLNLANSKWAGAVLTGASFQGATLDFATGLAGVNGGQTEGRLARAQFNRASLKNVDFSYAQLYGADFTQANLENANLQGAKLLTDPDAASPILAKANLTGAHLKNVNLANADLTDAVLTSASIYGSGLTTPPATCSTDISSCTPTGATCSCATLSGANLTRTNFANAYLYGVDFTQNTVINETDFTGAILISANFSDANWRVTPTQGGAPPLLTGAYLQGVDMHDANLTDAVLAGAYLDFGAKGSPVQGNQAFLKLSGGYTAFNGWSGGPGACVAATYGGVHWSLLPTTTRMTCPDGLRRTGGCGALDPDNANWKSGSPLAAAAVPGFYLQDASFDKANPTNPVCNFGSLSSGW